MKCPYCNAPMVEELLDYIVEIDGQEARLEDVPTWVCETCDHTEVEDEVIEAVEDKGKLRTPKLIFLDNPTLPKRLSQAPRR